MQVSDSFSSGFVEATRAAMSGERIAISRCVAYAPQTMVCHQSPKGEVREKIRLFWPSRRTPVITGETDREGEESERKAKLTLVTPYNVRLNPGSSQQSCR